MGKKKLRKCLGLGCDEKVMENKKKRKIKVPKHPRRYGNPKKEKYHPAKSFRGNSIGSI